MGDNLTGQTDQEKLHGFRKEIDVLIQYTEYLLNTENTEQDPTQYNIGSKAGREMALVRTKLQEAKMWAGKCLEQLGSELPKEFRDKA